MCVYGKFKGIVRNSLNQVIWYIEVRYIKDWLYLVSLDFELEWQYVIFWIALWRLGGIHSSCVWYFNQVRMYQLKICIRKMYVYGTTVLTVFSYQAGYTPLHIACHCGQLPMVKFLLEENGDVAATTAVGYTPLHQAAQQGHCAIVNSLLDRGALPNATTNVSTAPVP